MGCPLMRSEVNLVPNKSTIHTTPSLLLLLFKSSSAISLLLLKELWIARLNVQQAYHLSRTPLVYIVSASIGIYQKRLVSFCPNSTPWLSDAPLRFWLLTYHYQHKMRQFSWRKLDEDKNMRRAVGAPPAHKSFSPLASAFFLYLWNRECTKGTRPSPLPYLWSTGVEYLMVAI